MDFSQMIAEELYQYGVDNPSTPYASELVDALIMSKDNESAMLRAGRYWSDSIYSERIFDDLMKYLRHFDVIDSIYKKYSRMVSFICIIDDDDTILYNSRDYTINYTEVDLIKEIFDSIPRDLLVEFINDKMSNEIYDDIAKFARGDETIDGLWGVESDSKTDRTLIVSNLLTFLLKDMRRDTDEKCCYIATHWPNSRYKDEVMDYIITVENPDALLIAGANVSDDRYDERIMEKMFDIAHAGGVRYINVDHISKAIASWPKERYNEEMLDYVLKSDNIEEILSIISIENGEDVCKIMGGMISDLSFENSKFSDGSFISHVINRLFYMKKNNLLYELGLKLSNEDFIPQIGYYLYKLGDEEYIEKAISEWGSNRCKYVCKTEVAVEY